MTEQGPEELQQLQKSSSREQQQLEDSSQSEKAAAEAAGTDPGLTDWGPPIGRNGEKTFNKAPDGLVKRSYFQYI